MNSAQVLPLGALAVDGGRHTFGRGERGADRGLVSGAGQCLEIFRLDGKSDHLGRALEFELVPHIGAVDGDGFAADVELLGDFLGRFA